MGRADLVSRLTAQSLAISTSGGRRQAHQPPTQICGAFTSGKSPGGDSGHLRRPWSGTGPAGLRAAMPCGPRPTPPPANGCPIWRPSTPPSSPTRGTPLHPGPGLWPGGPWPGPGWASRPIQYSAYDVDQRLVQLVDGFLALLDVRTWCSCGTSSPGPQAAGGRGAAAQGRALPRPASAWRLTAPPGGPLCAPRGPLLPQPLLGGAAKGMVAHYRAHLEGMLAGAGWEVATVPFSSETVYVLSAPDAQRPGRPRSLPTRATGALRLPAFFPDATRAGVRTADARRSPRRRGAGGGGQHLPPPARPRHRADQAGRGSTASWTGAGR